MKNPCWNRQVKKAHLHNPALRNEDVASVVLDSNQGGNGNSWRIHAENFRFSGDLRWSKIIVRQRDILNVNVWATHGFCGKYYVHIRLYKITYIYIHTRISTFPKSYVSPKGHLAAVSQVKRPMSVKWCPEEMAGTLRQCSNTKLIWAVAAIYPSKD